MKRVDAVKRFSLIIWGVCMCLRTAAADTLRIALTGDIMMGTTYPEPRLPQNGGRSLFRDVAPLLASADIAAGNLEGPLCDGGQTHKLTSKSCYAFRTPVSYAPLLRAAGYDFLSLSNNHFLTSVDRSSIGIARRFPPTPPRCRSLATGSERPDWGKRHRHQKLT